MNKFDPRESVADAADQAFTSPARNRRSLLPPILWIISSGFVLYLMVLDYGISDGVVIGQTEVWPRDFVNLWAGGKLIAARDFVSLYTPDAFRAFQSSIFGPVGPHIYSYPPTAFIFASVFSQFPYVTAACLWLLSTATFFFYAARPWWPRDGGWPVVALVTPAALLNIWTGHYAFILGGLLLVAWQLLDRRPVFAGIAIGLLAIKPQFAVLIPLALLIRRDWRAILTATATVAAMVVGSALYYGVASWTEFFGRATGKQVSVIDAQGAFFGKMSGSAATAMLELGSGWTAAIAAQAMFSGLGLVLVVVAAWRRMPTDKLGLLVATCTFLVLPYSISYDFVLLCLGAWIVAVDPTNPVADRSMAMIGFVAPTLGIVAAMFGAPVMPLMVAALAVAQFRVFSRPA